MYHLMNGRFCSIWRFSPRIAGNLPAIRLKAGRRSLIAGKYSVAIALDRSPEPIPRVTGTEPCRMQEPSLN
jgi:hypothetical protein